MVAEMEEKAGRLARETAGGSEGKVGGSQQVVQVVRVDFAGDGGVVAGRAGVFQDGSGVGGEPKKTEDSRVQSWGRGAQIVKGEQSFGDEGDFGEVEGRCGSVADGDDGSGKKCCGGDQIVMRGRGIDGGAERAGVDDGTLERAA